MVAGCFSVSGFNAVVYIFCFFELNIASYILFEIVYLYKYTKYILYIHINQ